MVSPVRIRVPPLLKVLQIVKKVRDSAVLPNPFDKGMSTAGSSKDLYQCGCGRALHAFRGAGVDGGGHPDVDAVSEFVGAAAKSLDGPKKPAERGCGI
jgi:hypothetical protein